MEIKQVAGVVVLYNPDSSALDNIYSYLGQLTALYAVDNSENKNNLIIPELLKNKNIIYLPQEENIGVAKAYNIAGKKALEEGYEYLLTMDQDSKAPDKMVQELQEIYNDNPDVGIVAPLHYNENIVAIRAENLVEEKPYVMSSGNLINLQIFKNIGGFNEDLFIDYVDIEYGLRLQESCFRILQVNSVLLTHKEGNLIKRRFLSKMIYVYNHQPIRWYYKIRNYLYLRKEFNSDYPIYFREELIRNCKNIIKIFLYEKDKCAKCRFILKGLIDYSLGKKKRIIIN